MEAFSASLALCAGNSPVTGESPTQRPVTRSFDVFFDLRLNKRLSKQPWGWWFETPPRSSWRHCNAKLLLISYKLIWQSMNSLIPFIWTLYSNSNMQWAFYSVSYTIVAEIILHLFHVVQIVLFMHVSLGKVLAKENLRLAYCAAWCKSTIYRRPDSVIPLFAF